jgi:hypothetical protein
MLPHRSLWGKDDENRRCSTTQSIVAQGGSSASNFTHRRRQSLLAVGAPCTIGDWLDRHSSPRSPSAALWAPESLRMGAVASASLR